MTTRSHRIILWMGMSLDGYFEGPDHDLSWHFVDDEFHSWVNAELARMGAFLHGRRTYEEMARVWPAMRDDPSAAPPHREFARIWLDMPKVVWSRTLPSVDWNATLERDVDPERVRALERDVTGDMTIGGADLAASFLAHDLIDEVRLFMQPAVIGAGTRLFAEGQHLALRLEETRTFGNGVVMLRYAVVRG